MFASVTNVTTPNVFPNYLSATGIQVKLSIKIIKNENNFLEFS